MKRTSIYTIPLLLVGAAAAVAATLPDKPAIATRQASMKEMAAATKQIAGMFDGKIAYDAPAFRQAAETIQRCTDALAAEFPGGSLGPPLAAKPEIDQSRAEFEALARHIGTLASALAADAVRGTDRWHIERHEDGTPHSNGRQSARETGWGFPRSRSFQAAGGTSPASDPAGLHKLPRHVSREGSIGGYLVEEHQVFMEHFCT